jgi:hypothetical protein
MTPNNQLAEPVAERAEMREVGAASSNLFRPSIHRKTDGLLLVSCTGRARFLTWVERLQLWLGLTDARKLERKFCRHANTSEIDRSSDCE